MRFTKTMMAALTAAVLLSNLGSISYVQQSFALSSSSSIAQTEVSATVPSIVTDFLDTLVNVGPRDALRVWSDSYNFEAALAQDPDMPIYVDDFSQGSLTPEERAEQFEDLIDMSEFMLEMAAGDCSGYTILDSLPFGEKTQILYVVTEHEDAPVFWNFTVYQPENKTVWNIPNDGWIITKFVFNTNANEVIPMSVIDRWISE